MGRRSTTRVAPGPANSSLLSLDELADGGDADRAYFRRLRWTHLLLPPIGSPYAPLRRRWLLILLFFCLIEALYIPYCLAFQHPRRATSFELPYWLLFPQWAADGCLWLEILLMFRTTLARGPLDGSHVELSSSTIARGYIRRLAVDAFSLLPLDIIDLALSRDGLSWAGLRSLRSLALRLNRLLHAYRLGAYHGREVLMLSRMRRVVCFWCAFLAYTQLRPRARFSHGLVQPFGARDLPSSLVNRCTFLVLTHWVACCWWGIRYGLGEGSGGGGAVPGSGGGTRIDWDRGTALDQYLTCAHPSAPDAASDASVRTCTPTPRPHSLWAHLGWLAYPHATELTTGP